MILFLRSYFIHSLSQKKKELEIRPESHHIVLTAERRHKLLVHSGVLLGNFCLFGAS